MLLGSSNERMDEAEGADVVYDFTMGRKYTLFDPMKMKYKPKDQRLGDRQDLLGRDITSAHKGAHHAVGVSQIVQLNSLVFSVARLSVTAGRYRNSRA